jgi:AcrR family transcriptional regulator
MSMRSGRSAGKSPHTDPARARVLSAALDLFAELGYHATTTKQISVRAGVAEPTLFRQFGTKAELYEAAIVEPFSQFIADWTGSWANFSAELTTEEIARQLVDGLLGLVRKDKRLFQELIVARNDPQSDLYASAVAVSSQLRDALRAVQDVGLEIAAERRLVGLDPAATIGAVASMVIGAILLEDWVYPSGVRIPGRQRLVAEMAALIADGIAHRSE